MIGGETVEIDGEVIAHEQVVIFVLIVWNLLNITGDTPIKKCEFFCIFLRNFSDRPVNQTSFSSTTDKYSHKTSEQQRKH